MRSRSISQKLLELYAPHWCVFDLMSLSSFRGDFQPNEPAGGGGRGSRPRMDLGPQTFHQPSPSLPNGQGSAPKSNNDFRAMLFKK